MESVDVFTWESEVRNWNPDASGFEISQLKNWNPDVSGIEFRTRPDLKFLNWKIEIRTCPKLKSGRVQIWNFSLINRNPDTSGFEIFQEKMEIRTRPDLYFSIDKYESGLAKFVMSSSPDFNFIYWKMKIRTRPDLYFTFDKYQSGLAKFGMSSSPNFNFSIRKWKSGHVRIFIFQLKIKNPDASGFQIFNWRKKKSGLTKTFFTIS